MINKKYFRLAIILILVLLCIYFYFFFQKGIHFDDTFLTLNKKDNVFEYIGKKNGNYIKITVVGNIIAIKASTITYELEDKSSYTYEVKISEYFEDNGEIIILENDVPKFRGTYRPTNIGVVLWDINGDPVIENNYFNNSFIVTNSHIASTVFKDNITKRGSLKPILYAIVISIILFIDIKWPLFFFQLNHFLDVKDPKPTDYYLATQKFSRYIGGIAIIILLIAGLMM